MEEEGCFVIAIFHYYSREFVIIRKGMRPYVILFFFSFKSRILTNFNHPIQYFCKNINNKTRIVFSRTSILSNILCNMRKKDNLSLTSFL